MNLKPVGILGGMGPEATILLQKKLLQAIPEAVDDSDHIPLLIDMNPQVPSRIAHLIDRTGEDPTPTIVKMAKRLEESGALALAMPCNTAHYYSGAIKNAVSIPFLDMVLLSCAHVEKLGPKAERLGILASPAVHHTKLFERPLSSLGNKTIWPHNKEQMLKIIQHVKQFGPTNESAKALQNISLQLANHGATIQLIACSEFSILKTMFKKNRKILVLDTLDILVKRIIQIARY